MENNLPNTAQPLPGSTPEPATPVMPPPVQPMPTPVMPSTPPPVDPIPQYTPPVQQVQSTNPTGKNNTVIIAILAVIALIVVIAALYIFAMKKNTSPTAVTDYNNSATQTATTPTPTATPSSPQSDAAAVQGIDVGDPTVDLQSINTDLSQL